VSLGAHAAFFFIRFLSLASSYVVSCNQGASTLPATALSGGGCSFARIFDVESSGGMLAAGWTEFLNFGVLGVLGGFRFLTSLMRGCGAGVTVARDGRIDATSSASSELLSLPLPYVS
jgi:hypothetical protein